MSRVYLRQIRVGVLLCVTLLLKLSLLLWLRDSTVSPQAGEHVGEKQWLRPEAGHGPNYGLFTVHWNMNLAMSRCQRK